jgi:hypothetical protein
MVMAVASRRRSVSSVSPLSEIARKLKSIPLKRPRPISATACSTPPLAVSARDTMMWTSASAGSRTYSTISTSSRM